MERARDHRRETVREARLDLGRHTVPDRGRYRFGRTVRVVRVGEQPPHIVRDEHRKVLVQGDAEQSYLLARRPGARQQLARLIREDGRRHRLKREGGVADLLEKRRQEHCRTLGGLAVAAAVEVRPLAAHLAEVDRDLDQPAFLSAVGDVSADRRQPLSRPLGKARQRGKSNLRRGVALDDALHKRRFKAGVPGLGEDVPEIVLVFASAAHHKGFGDFARIRSLVLRQLPEPVVK